MNEMHKKTAVLLNYQCITLIDSNGVSQQQGDQSKCGPLCVCVCVDGRGIKKKIEFRSLMAMRKKLGESGSSAPNTHSSSETGSADIAVLPLQENKARNLVLLSTSSTMLLMRSCVWYTSPHQLSPLAACFHAGRLFVLNAELKCTL